MKTLFKLLFTTVVVMVVIVLFAGGGLVRYIINFHSERLTGVAMSVAGAEMSILSGQLTLTNVAVHNPEGYKGPHAATIEEVQVNLRPNSLLQPVVQIDYIGVKGLRVVFEGDMNKNNIQDIQQALDTKVNAPQVEGDGGAAAPETAGKKLAIAHMQVTGNKAAFYLGLPNAEAATVDLGDLELTNLGTDGNGMDARDVLDQVLVPLFERINRAALEATTNPASLLDQGSKFLQGLGEKIKGIF
ncbi:MAG: AsmA family protein [Alphaproteobacteria bacterium]